MRKPLLVLASIAALSLAPSLAFADTNITISPELDTWVGSQPDTSVDFSGDVVIGTELPGSYKYIEVPDNNDYSYVVVNKKRVLVDRKTHKIIKVY